MSSHLQASALVVERAGGAWDASLNAYTVGGDALVCTVQVDEWVYVVGQDSFDVARYSLEQWLDGEEQTEAPFIEADDSVQAWELLQLVRQGAFLWQCGACDAWIHTSDRPRVGVLRCSTCRDGGVDFRHADRHVSD